MNHHARLSYLRDAAERMSPAQARETLVALLIQYYTSREIGDELPDSFFLSGNAGITDPQVYEALAELQAFLEGSIPEGSWMVDEFVAMYWGSGATKQ